LTAARAQVASDNASLASFQVALQSVRDEAKVGQRTQQDVLNAEQDVLNAQVQVASTKRNIVVSSYTLMAAVGRLGIAAIDLRAAPYDHAAHLEANRRNWFGITITRPDGRREHFDLWQHETKVETASSRKRP
jgi:outer membrane protein